MTQEVIRLATPADGENYLKLIQAAFKEVKDYGIDWPSTNATLESVLENIDNAAVIVLERNGNLIASLSVRFPYESEEPVSAYPFVWWFATHPAYRGQGVGTYLLNHIEEEWLKKIYKSPAYVLGTNTDKHPWLFDMYKRKGFIPYFERPESGDALMYKVLIAEKFNEKLLAQPVYDKSFVEAR